MASEQERALLILDLDETLVHSVEDQLEVLPSFAIQNYSVYTRPFLSEFLHQCAAVFDMAVWSSGSHDYVKAIVDKLFPERKPLLVWSRERCAERRDPETDETFYKKDLKKVARLGYSLTKTIIVEDDFRNVQGHYGNAVIIKPFKGDSKDNELIKLLPFLLWLSQKNDVRSIDKTAWRKMH